MSGMIPAGSYSVHQMAGLLGVSDRRVRDLIARGEMAATRVGKRSWAITGDDALVWEHAHPRRGRRLTSEAQWALIAVLTDYNSAWCSPLVRHRARQRISDWTPQQIADAVSQRGPMPEEMQEQSGRAPNLRAFARTESADPDLYRHGLERIADLQEIRHQQRRYEWWERRGIQFQDFWAALDLPATACCRTRCLTARSGSTDSG